MGALESGQPSSLNVQIHSLCRHGAERQSACARQARSDFAAFLTCECRGVGSRRRIERRRDSWARDSIVRAQVGMVTSGVRQFRPGPFLSTGWGGTAGGWSGGRFVEPLILRMVVATCGPPHLLVETRVTKSAHSSLRRRLQ